MTTFDDREHAFASLFAHDQDLALQARRRRKIGLWAARPLGRTGEEADSYAMQVLMGSIEKGDTEAVVAKVVTDLQGHGLAVTDHQTRRRLDGPLAEAVDHVRHD